MKRVTLKVGSRKVHVETTPLPVGGSNFRDKTLVRPRERVLVLKPSRGMRLVAVLFLLLGAVPLALGTAFLLQRRFEPVGNWVLLGFGVVFSVSGLLLLLLPRRLEFDLDRGQLTQRRCGFARRRPLTDVLAVQLINGGWHTSRNPHGGQTSYFTYQLNLVLDDDRQPRLNLTNHTDWDSTWRSASDLAAFLGVTLMDHVSEEAE